MLKGGSDCRRRPKQEGSLGYRLGDKALQMRKGDAFKKLFAAEYRFLSAAGRVTSFHMMAGIPKVSVVMF